MNILELLKKGVSLEDITEGFYDALEDAQVEYKKYLKAEEEKKARIQAEKEKAEYKKMKQDQARDELGAALVKYFIEMDIKPEWDEADFARLESELREIEHYLRSGFAIAWEVFFDEQ